MISKFPQAQNATVETLSELCWGQTVDKLYRAGISLNLNTDARTIVNVTFTEEYEKMRTVFGWDITDFYATNCQALRAAFISDVLKSKLLAQLTQCYTP